MSQLDDKNKNNELNDENETTRLLPKPQNFQTRDLPKLPPPSADDDDDDDEEDGSTLIFAFILMLVFQLGNRIFGRLQAFPMHNYPLYMNMLSVIVYVPVCFLYIIPTVYFTNRISKEQQEIPKHKFAVMGAYDSVAGIMQTFAVNYITNSSTIVLVQQSAIPISMVISKITLQSTYTNAQYLGSTVVMLGIVAVLLPTFFSDSPEESVDANGVSTASPGHGYAELGWILVMIISCVPMCLSSVYKEKALGETEIDVIYLNGWVAIFQFLIAIPLCFPSAHIIGISMSNILPNMYSGMLCSFGINTITEHHNPDNQPLDDCAMGPYFVSLYIAFNVIYNILIVVILKFGSANILWIASTVIVPLSNVAFSLDFMPNHQPLKAMDMVGLVVIMAGLIIYRFSEELLSVWDSIRGYREKPDEKYKRRLSKSIKKKAERKQMKYYGLNQLENLQSLLDVRVMKEQRQALFRSPQQIRSSLLYRLGIPPSPQITMGDNGAPRRSFIESRGPAVPLNSNLIRPIPKSYSKTDVESLVKYTDEGIAMSKLQQEKQKTGSGQYR